MHDSHTAEAADHLQAAALSMIGAARSFLDALEELVGDPDRMADAADVLASVVGAATRVAGPPPSPDAGGRRDRPGEPAPVERIPVT